MNLSSIDAAALRVGTFNIRWADPNDGAHHWEKRRERLFEFLRSWQLDVLGLQEPLHFQRDQIRLALPAYGSVGIGREDGREAGEFCPVFYRLARFELIGSGTFWFSETPELPGSRAWGCWHPRICTWAFLRDKDSERAFYVYNQHWDNESQSARQHSAQILLDHIRRRATRDPVLVMGDFNAEDNNPAVARLSDPDSPVPVSALRAMPSPSSGTFHGFTGDAPGTPIDHLFLSPDWEVLDAQILRGDGARPFLSDHFPVAATLNFR